MKSDGSNPVQLTQWGDATELGGVDWSLDGRKLLFVSDRDGDQDTYVAEFDMP